MMSKESGSKGLGRDPFGKQFALRFYEDYREKRNQGKSLL
jgi:hypothetical protein